MKKQFIAALLLVTTLVACPNPNPSPTVSSVVVSANPTSINTNATSAISAVVSGTGAFGNGVTWSIVSGAGTLSNQATTSATFTASAQAGSTVIRATSTQDSSKSGTVTVTTVLPSGDTTAPTVISTTASSNTSVTVVFSEAITGGNLATNFSFPSQTLSVIAASLASDNKTVTLTTSAQSAISYALLVSSSLTDLTGNAYNLALQNTTQTSFQGTNSSNNSVTAVTISAASTTVLPATDTMLTATVTGNGTFSNAVTWSIVSGTAGKLSTTTGSEVDFQTPGSGSINEGTVVIKATSNANSSKFGTITMTVQAASITGLTLTTSKTALSTSGTSQLTATVTSSGSQFQFSSAVNWKIENDGIGTLSSNNGSLGSLTLPSNTYTAPATSFGRVVRITASSVQDPTQKKTIFISVNPNKASISGGQNHSLALKSDNTVLAWGQGTFGQLGTGNFNNQPTPVAVSGTKNADIVAIAAGGFFSLALKTDGSLISWGDNTHGQLGNNLQGSINSTSAPVDVGVTFKFTSIATGSNHSLALRDDGNVYSWGENSKKQLGNTAPNNTTPTLVLGTSNTVAIAAGEKHSLALKSDGTILAWGSDEFGQLGDNAPAGTTSVTPVPVQDATNIVAIAAGRSFSLALKSDGTLLAWGANFSGELGDGSSTDRTTPVAVVGTNSNNIVAIAAGLNHSVALKKDGTVLTWGSDEFGQLGDGAALEDKTTPVVVGGASNIIAIAAGGLHTLALKSDGTMESWGKDDLGQLGNSSPLENSASPVSVLLGAFTIRLP